MIPEDMEAVNRLFRAVHTIKGSGAMFGFNSLVDFTHHLETVLDRLRDEEIAVTKELIDIILSSRDHLKILLDHNEEDGPVDSEEGTRLVVSLSSYLPETAEKCDKPEPGVYGETPGKLKRKQPTASALYRAEIFFRTVQTRYTFLKR